MTNSMPILMHRYEVANTVEVAAKAGATFLVLSIPWELIEPHQKQAQINHGQTLERLKARGGLGASEAVAILEDRSWQRMSNVQANAALVRIINQQLTR